MSWLTRTATLSWCHGLSSSKVKPKAHSAVRGYQSVADVKTTKGEVDLDVFRKYFWLPELPLRFTSFQELPASKTWFSYEPGTSHVSFSEKLEKHHELILPYEYIIPDPSSPDLEASAHPDLHAKNLQDFREWLINTPPDREDRIPILLQVLDHFTESRNAGFQQFDAPLDLLMRAHQFNRTRSHPSQRITRLYIAQSSIDHLPPTLSQDLPVPPLVQGAGKGDIYASSIWVGLEPTYTPLHRDPNPNLFCQVVGGKTVRLLPPPLGAAVFARVRQALGSAGHSRFRGPEMMEGPERALLHRAVWADGADMVQASLGPGDALFIPKGWWHSVVSAGDEGGLNASVNWWFR
ncbi:hypothetical protein F4810DRAFT_266468 [Camillea tinctor]|nr:hypothetical protein F4810DRAFT_266468 [Camillea tinctor]